MKILVIGNQEAVLGFSLVGVQGKAVNSAPMAQQALDDALANPDLGIILVTEDVAELIEAHRTTLVFVNTRRLAERVTFHLGERLGREKVTSHHGSLSAKLRLDAENRLKRGELKALVATAIHLQCERGLVDVAEDPRARGVAALASPIMSPLSCRTAI